MINKLDKLYSNIATKIRMQLELKMIPGDRALWLASELSLSRAQVFRKLKGSAWKLEELIKITSILDCSLNDLLDDLLIKNTVQKENNLDGIIIFDNKQYSCLFECGEPGIGFYAENINSIWHISTNQNKSFPSKKAVCYLRITGIINTKPLILIIDNDQYFSNNLCEELERNNFTAISIRSADGLEDKLQRFDNVDAFIIDLTTAKEGGEQLVAVTCSSRHSNAPIIFLVAGKKSSTLPDDFGNIFTLNKENSPNSLVSELKNILAV